MMSESTHQLIHRLNYMSMARVVGLNFSFGSFDKLLEVFQRV